MVGGPKIYILVTLFRSGKMTSRSHPVIEMNDLDHDLDTDIDVDDGHSLITDPNSNAFDFESGSLYDDLLSGPISLSDIGTGDFGSAVIDDIIEEEEEEQIIEDVQKTEYEGIVNVNDREIEVEEDEDEGEDIGDIEIVATPIAPLQPPTPVQQPGALKKQSSSLLHKVDDLKDDSLPTIEKFLDVMDTKIEIKYSDEVIKQVSNGFLELFGVPLTRMTERLQEFSKTQHQLLSAIDAETEKFQKIPEELQEIGALVFFSFFFEA